jgi:formate-dependent nitrite reductase cytochrome c552 subunit
MELQRVRVRQAAAVEMLRKLREVPCADCGGTFAPHQMDFDHREPSTKSFNVTTGPAKLVSAARLKAEVEKCDIACANCHRIRTQRSTDELRLVRVLTGQSTRIERKRRLWRGHQQVLNELRAVPCGDCGHTFPCCAMEFDHREASLKKAHVSRLIGRAGLATILAEVAKCDVVCANCHRMRTYLRRLGAA